MTTTTTPTAANGVSRTIKEDDYETQLLAIVASTCNAGREAQKLDENDAQEERRCVTVDDLKHGSPGEKHLRSYLMTLSPRARRAMGLLGDLGRRLKTALFAPPGVRLEPACDYWNRSKQQLARPCDDMEDLAILLDALRSLAEDLRRGYRWAHRHGALEKLGASLDESGAALRAVEEEEFHDEVTDLSYAQSSPEARRV